MNNKKKKTEELIKFNENISTYKNLDINFKIGIGYFGRMILSSLQIEKEDLEKQHSKSAGFETIELSGRLIELNNIIEYINEELELELSTEENHEEV